jgi:hypothetical protein
MSKELMNEAERFLLERWGEARLLEQSMEGVRTKYKALFERIIEAVTEGHPELDANACALTQSWTQGQIAIGRKSWPGAESNTRVWLACGLWVLNVQLEVLAAEDSEPPIAMIDGAKKSNLDFDAARVVVKQAAMELLTPEELKQTEWTESGDKNLLYLPAPSKRQLLDALSNGDGQPFVELFVSQFDMMARFVPVLNKVFPECMKKE